MYALTQFKRSRDVAFVVEIEFPTTNLQAPVKQIQRTNFTSDPAGRAILRLSEIRPRRSQSYLVRTYNSLVSVIFEEPDIRGF